MTPVHTTLRVLLFPIVFSITDYALAERQDCVKGYEFLKSQRNGDIIALPHTGPEMDSQYDTHQICYRGEDVTQWAAGPGMEITSGISNLFKNGSVAIVTAHQRLDSGGDYSEGGYRSALILLRVDEDTKHLSRYELMTQQPHNDPTKSIDDFHVVGFDDFNKTIYFKTPAWATSDAIYSFPVSSVLQGEKPNLKYWGPGRVDMVINDLGISSKNIGNVLIWRDEISPYQGRLEVLYLFDATGKQVCKVDSSDSGYRFKPTCINR